jgi:hypothetical protein
MKKSLFIVTLFCLILSFQLFAQPVKPENKMGKYVAEKYLSFQKDLAISKVNKADYKSKYSSKLLSVNKAGNMFVNILVNNNIDAVANTITSWGGSIHNKGTYTIYAWVPMDKLADLTALDGVAFVDKVGHFHSQTGSYTSAGYHQLLADSAISIFYTNGQDANGNPIKVGAISDGMQRWSNSQSSGDLPSTNFGYVSYNGFNGTNSIGYEGTAMMEIVHDLAPGAGIYFGGVGEYIDAYGDTIYCTPLDMAGLIGALYSSANCKIIVDDIGWDYDEPWFEDGDIATAIADFQSHGGTYISAAGNYKQQMYSGKPGCTSIGGGGKNLITFDEGGFVTKLTFTLTNYSAFNIFMQWDDHWPGASNYYNLYLYNNKDSLLDSCIFQTGYPRLNIFHQDSLYYNKDTFYVKVSYNNWNPNYGNYKNVKILINPENISPTGETKFALSPSGSGGQINGHSAAPNCISVAAYSAYTTNKLENFSSKGPSVMFPWAQPGNESNRNTPVITATDSVDTKVGKDGYFNSPFDGTSAAAPHVAAVAALYFSRFPTQTSAQFITAMTSSAKSIAGGTGGTWNANSGYGKISAYDCLVKGLTILTSPNVASNTSWGLDYIKGTAAIASGVTVTIDANTTTVIDGNVNFGSASSKLQINGTLIVTKASVFNLASCLVLGPNGRIYDPNLLSVTVNQLDASSSSFGNVGHWVAGSYDSSKTVPYTFPSFDKVAERMRGSQVFKTGTTQKFQYWNGKSSKILNPDTTVIAAGQPNNITSFFSTANNATIQAQLDGVVSGDALNFLDPWLIDTTDAYGNRNQGMSDWHRAVGYSNYNVGTGTKHMGVFLNQSVASGIYYSVQASVPQKVINGFTGYFQGWVYDQNQVTLQQIGTSPYGFDQKAVVFKQAGATLTASYKAHLGTGAPSRTNTKNQRRIIWGMDQMSRAWVSVYESMGDIWMTMYDTNGYVLIPETRLNTNQGVASNPTISNPIHLGNVGYDYDRAIIGWLENVSGTIELHLQAIKFESESGDYWGWTTNPHTTGDRSTSHAMLNGFWNPDAPVSLLISDNPISTARPVLSLMKNGNGLLVTYAYESSTSGKYLVAGQFQTSAANQDLEDVTKLDEKIVSTDVTASLPAIAAIDTSHIFIYFTTGGYTTLKLLEFNYSTSAVSNLVLASGDAIIHSIQATSNNIMCTRAVVADVTNYSVGAYGGTTVDYFYSGIPIYGYAPPQLLKKYNSFNQPSVMSVDLSHSLYDYTPVNITMNIPTNNYFTQYRQQLNGKIYNTTLGSSIAGTFLREKASSGSDSVITLIKTSTSPAGFVRYPSTGGGLQKESADKQQTLITATKSVRLWHDKQGNWHTVSFNFDTLQVDILRDQENSNTLCAVRFPRVPKSGSLISQPDSLKAPVTLVLERQGKIINSFSPASWTKLSANNIPGIQNGDIVKFNLPSNNADSVWGYEEVSYIGMKGLSKDNGGEISEDIPIPTEYALNQNFPNPFNPSTVIEYQLPKDGYVTLKVYDILGREVRTLVDGYKTVGKYSVSFDASKLASGVYIYQLKSNNYSSIKKMILTK